MTAASKPHTQQAAPKPYRPVLPGSGPPTASRGAPVGAHVSHDDLGPLLPTPPLTPPSRGSQRVKNRSPGVQKGQSPTAKRESNRGERPLVVSPGVTTPGVNLSGDKILASPRATNTLQAQANPNPNRNPNPNPSPNPQHSPVSSGPPRKPRAPYNPLARTGPLAPAAPTGQTPVPTGQSASPTGRSAASTGQSASLTANSVPITPTKRRTPAAVYQPPAKSFEPSTVGVADMTSAEASADVTRNALRLLVVGESDANALRGQRSPEPSPLSAELPSILAMLLPVENANKSAAPPGYAPSFDVYKPESDHLISATESPGASHVASNDWVGTTESGIDSWGEPASIESPIASEKAVGRKKTKTRRGADNQDDHGSEVCCICFDNPKNGAIIPCGHCLCYECGTLIKEKRGECPFCNTKIESVFKLFF